MQNWVQDRFQSENQVPDGILDKMQAKSVLNGVLKSVSYVLLLFQRIHLEDLYRAKLVSYPDSPFNSIYQVGAL